jgi:hypothetical protein
MTLKYVCFASVARITQIYWPQPLVRSITCWTLGRYASWIAQITSEEHRATYFVPTMEGVRLLVVYI